MRRPDHLAEFLFGAASTRGSLLRILFANPQQAIHLRELARQCGVSPPAIAKEVGKLLGEGVVVERARGNTRTVQANMRSPMALDIQRIVLEPPRVARARRRAAVVRGAPKGRRPATLREAAAWGRELGSRDAFLREFLDEFYSADSRRQAAMIREEPLLDPHDERANAYYAAVAEHLAMRNGVPIPSWTSGPERFLERPYFPSGLESLKAILLVESPTAFRRRLIFVDADPLSRPRRRTRAR